MGNLPVVHEIGTSCSSLRKRDVWEKYSEESIVGSGVKAAVLAINKDLKGAERCGKGMGRAFGQAILGGGLLSDVPILKEVFYFFVNCCFGWFLFLISFLKIFLDTLNWMFTAFQSGKIFR
jgi:hypothetical protein